MAKASVAHAGVILRLELTEAEVIALRGMMKNPTIYHQYPSEESEIDRQIRKAIFDALVGIGGF